MTSILFIFNLLNLIHCEVKLDTAATCQLKRYSYSNGIVSYVYDEQRRPSVIYIVKSDGTVLATEKYIYKADSIEHTIVQNFGDLVITNLYKLNEIGLVESGTVTWISKKNPTSVSKYIFEYDSEGHLIHKIETRNNQIANERHFFYENGNLIKEYSMTGEITYEYHLDKTNTKVTKFLPFGKGSKNLVRLTDHSHEGGKTRSGCNKFEYSYDFDAFGNVIKEYRKGYLYDERVEISETNYVYDCN